MSWSEKPEWAKDRESLIDHLKATCPEVFRTAYWPHTGGGGGTSPRRLTSKLGGLPWYEPSKYPQPKCGSCGTKVNLLCQLTVAKLPKEICDLIGHQSGLFQVG